MRYRADVDGLRAVAVLLVVLFHAGFPLLSGGYIGVDVFFVISGFLITRIIAEEVTAGRFSILHFYERRIRRIFPALAVVLLFSWAASSWILLPRDFKDFSQSVTAAALFCANVLFSKEAGYFAHAADTKPLLHTWSLSVEEQFYIGFPLLLLLLRGKPKSFWIACLGVLSTGSLGLSIYLVTAYPKAAFFLLPGRAWELLAGSLLALGALPRPRTRAINEALGAVGLALIVWSAVSFTRFTDFPGWAALAPCAGALLFIHSSEMRQSVAARLLSIVPLVFLGRISYSLYLWHWPLFVLLKQQRAAALTTAEATACVMASIVAAALSWKFVEQPFRGAGSKISRPQAFAFAGSVFVVGLSLGAFGHFSNGWPSRFSPEVVALAAFRDPNLLPETCWPDAPCLAGQLDGRADVILWGDSHARAVAGAVSRVAAQQGRRVEIYAGPGCLPAAGVFRAPDPAGCGAFAEDVLARLLRKPGGRTVIFIARWSHILEGEQDPTRDAATIRLSDRSNARLDHTQQWQLLTDGLRSTMNRLMEHGDSVVVVYPIPEQLYSVPRILPRRLIRGQEPGGYFLPLAEYQQRHQTILRFLDALPRSDQLRVIQPEEALCPQERCLAYADGSPLYIDADHLSSAGAARLEPLFEAAMHRPHRTNR